MINQNSQSGSKEFMRNISSLLLGLLTWQD